MEAGAEICYFRVWSPSPVRRDVSGFASAIQEFLFDDSKRDRVAFRLRAGPTSFVTLNDR